jgi:hypothetical protein
MSGSSSSSGQHLCVSPAKLIPNQLLAKGDPNSQAFFA